MDDQAYSELLASLRKDLQLDAAVDLLPGSVGIAMVNDGSPTATSATVGTASALPADPAGYLVFKDQKGVVRKIPFYNN